jgi:hypothetical protein
MRALRNLLLTLGVALWCGAVQASTFAYVATVSLGQSHAGDAGNIYVQVLDNAGNVDIARAVINVTAGAITAGGEDADNAGNGTGSYHVYLTLNTSWNYPLRIKFDDTNATGVVAQSTVHADEAMALDTSGRVLLQPTQTGVTIPTVTNANMTQIGGVTAQATAGAVSVTFPTVWTDPWATNIPGSYSGTQAGYVLGTLSTNLPNSIWTTPVPGSFATGTAGHVLGAGGGGGGGGSDPWATALTDSGAVSGTFGYALKNFMLASPSGWLTGDTASINSIVNGVFAHQVESTVTLQQAMEIIAAYCGGNVNTGSHTYSGINTPGTIRLTYIIDAFGNRNFTISP